jgi:multimeric flavodoxin WrbA
VSKKILIIAGSPRKSGNTATVVGWFAEGAETEGATVKIVDAARLKYKTAGCCSCYGCQVSQQFRCVILDEATEVVASFTDYDTVVFATPVYFFSLSAQIKMLMDRMFSLFKFCDGKTIHNLQKVNFALIATCGGTLDDSGVELVDQTIKKIVHFIGKTHKSLLIPSLSTDAEETMKQEDLKAKVADFGKTMAKW